MSLGRQREGTAARCREQGRTLVPASAARVGPRLPSEAAGTLGSLPGLLGRKKAGGLRWCSPHPVLSPASRGPALLHRGHGSALAPSETSSHLPGKPGRPPKLGGFHVGLVLLSAVATCWSCRGPRGTTPGCHSACCICHRVPLKHGSVTCLYTTWNPAKIHNRFQPRNSVTSVFPPFFF